MSSIAVGPAADAELLSDIATWGRGRSYVVQDAKEVPQIFVKEARNVPTPAFDEKPVAPRVVKRRAFSPAWTWRTCRPCGDAPPWCSRTRRSSCSSTPEHDPLLAFWPVGLGRTAVFASDVKDRWGSAWVSWRGYAPFFASVVRAIQRPRPLPVALTVQAGDVRDGSRELRIEVDARTDEGGPRDLLRPRVQVQSGAGGAAQLPLHQVAPGRYEARVLAGPLDAVSVQVLGEERGTTAALFVPDPAREQRPAPADEPLLKSIASSTGGAWQPSGDAAVRTGSRRQAARQPLWPALLAVSLLLWFADLLLRRVRIMETAGRRRPAERSAVLSRPPPASP